MKRLILADKEESIKPVNTLLHLSKFVAILSNELIDGLDDKFYIQDKDMYFNCDECELDVSNNSSVSLKTHTELFKEMGDIPNNLILIGGEPAIIDLKDKGQLVQLNCWDIEKLSEDQINYIEQRLGLDLVKIS